jgi:hypothetical protein
MSDMAQAILDSLNKTSDESGESNQKKTSEEQTTLKSEVSR